MNDRQTHIEHFERGTHRVCELNNQRRKSDKPFAPGVITNARDMDNDFRELTPAESLFLWAAIVACCVGLIGLVSALIGWLSVVL